MIVSKTRWQYNLACGSATQYIILTAMGLLNFVTGGVAQQISKF